jgi:hypothetical protein
VHDGVLLEKGMPQFATLGPQQVHDIYEYIRAGARAALASGKGAATGTPAGASP